MASRKPGNRKLRVVCFGIVKWKVLETSDGRSRVIGYIKKVPVSKPVKTSAYVCTNIHHQYLAQRYTLTGALKKFEDIK